MGYLSSHENIILSTTQNPTQDANRIEFSPKSMTSSFESLASEDSGRSDDGVMHITWILKKIRKLEVEIKPATADVIARILSKVQGKEYYVTFWDTLTNTEMTKYVYTSNCSSEYSYNNLITAAKFSAIEIGGESA